MKFSCGRKLAKTCNSRFEPQSALGVVFRLVKLILTELLKFIQELHPKKYGILNVLQFLPSIEFAGFPN